MGKPLSDAEDPSEQVVTTGNIVGWSWADPQRAVTTLPPPQSSSGSQSGGAVVQPIPLPVHTGNAERYQFRRLLGKGGMGEVHLCKDLTVGRDVASKRILPDHIGAVELRNRFIREAQIQGQLEHPAIVPVYDLAVSSDGTVFFTMKRLLGRTLEEILKALREGDAEAVATFPRHRLLNAISTVCLAVEFAHSRGIVHRDLKPANIMLGDFGEVYVLDWGVAKVRGGTESGEVSVQSLEEVQATRAGQLVGTLAYMSPEQAAGQPQAIDARSDVFTLGTILFEILTFERLRDTGSPQDMLVTIDRGENARPSERAPKREVPPELEEICVRATSRKPEARYQTARELHQAIENYIAGERDVALRKQLAAKYSSAATKSMDQALTGGPHAEAARRAALSDVGRALGLDPTNSTALRVLRRVLTEPPQELPAEVEKQAQAEIGKQEGLRLRGLMISGLASIFLILMILLMGVRDWSLMSTLLALATVSMALRWFTSRRADITVWHYISLLVTFGLFACYGRLLGPLWILVFALIPHSVSSAFASHASFRQFSLFCASSLLIGMFVLEHVGLLQQSYHFEGGNLVIVSNLAAFHPLWTQALLLGISLICVWLTFLTISPMPKLRLQAEQRIALQAWHLRQLLPDSEQSMKIRS